MQFGLDQDVSNSVPIQLYEPFQQTPDKLMRRVATGIDAYVRTRDGVDPSSAFPAIRRTLTQLDSQMVVDAPETMEVAVADSIARQRFAMTLFSVFAAGALLLASIGIYGVLSYVVGQRTREIGIRMAMGAQKGDVVGAVLRDGARMTLPGIGIGLAVALVMTRLMSALLFGVTPTDVVTFASVALLLCLVALFACYLPARRASRLDPMQALRAD
jgi:ABC-type antimicrobial peptide transport system permease subunit